MAMTKKEKAEMQAAIDKAELLAALRWTQEVKPDVPPPEGSGYTEGWVYNSFSAETKLAWSCAVTHGYGKAPANGEYKTGYQGSRWLYSSEERALRAMRHKLEMECAERLLAIDRAILKLSEQEQ